MQRLRMRAAGQTLWDFWMDETSLVSLFGSIHVLHAPAAQTSHRVSKLAPDGRAEPSLLVVQPTEGALPGATVPVRICVQAAGGSRPLCLSIGDFQWAAGDQAPFDRSSTPKPPLPTQTVPTQAVASLTQNPVSAAKPLL